MHHHHCIQMCSLNHYLFRNLSHDMLSCVLQHFPVRPSLQLLVLFSFDSLLISKVEQRLSHNQFTSIMKDSNAKKASKKPKIVIPPATYPKEGQNWCLSILLGNGKYKLKEMHHHLYDYSNTHPNQLQLLAINLFHL